MCLIPHPNMIKINDVMWPLSTKGGADCCAVTDCFGQLGYVSLSPLTFLSGFYVLYFF